MLHRSGVLVTAAALLVPTTLVVAAPALPYSGAPAPVAARSIPDAESNLVTVDHHSGGRNDAPARRRGPRRNAESQSWLGWLSDEEGDESLVVLDHLSGGEPPLHEESSRKSSGGEHPQ